MSMINLIKSKFGITTAEVEDMMSDFYCDAAPQKNNNDKKDKKKRA